MDKYFICICIFINGIFCSEYAIHKPQHSAHEQFSLKFLSKSYKENMNLLIFPYAIETQLKAIGLGSYKITQYEFRNCLKNPLQVDELNEFHTETIFNLQTALNQGFYTQKHALYLGSKITVDPNFLTKTQKLCPMDIIYEDQNKSITTKIHDWVLQRFKKNLSKFPEINIKEAKGKIFPITYIDFSFYWKTPFDQQNTSVDSFQYPIGIKTHGIVDVMHQINNVDYFEDDALQAVELPLENHLSCVILLPKQDDNSKILSLVSKSNYFKKIISKMKKTNVDIRLPKIQLESPFYYKETLLKLGLAQPFSKLADFKYLDQNHALILDTPIQIGKISFQESGINTDYGLKKTKSVALTPEASININHSFLFFIIDSRNLTLYCSGCYQNPF